MPREKGPSVSELPFKALFIGVDMTTNHHSILSFSLATALLFAFACLVGAAEVKRLSPVRVDMLKTMVEQHCEKMGDNADRQALKEAVLAEFVTMDSSLKEGEGRQQLMDDMDNQLTTDKNLAKDALEKYPDYTAAELKELAAKEFPMYNNGDKITVVYKNRPKTTAQISGIFRGVRGDKIIIPPHSVLIDDMRDIVGNDGPKGEIAKYDKAYNTALRRQWIADYLENAPGQRVAFAEENRAEYLKQQLAKDAIVNEKNGWTEMDGQWYSPEALVSEAVDMVVAGIHREKTARLNEENSRRLAEVQGQLTVSSLAVRMIPPTAPKAKKNVVADAAEAADGSEEAAQDFEDTAAAEKDNTVRDFSADHQSSAPTTVEAPKHRIGTWVYIVVSAVVVLGIAFAVYKFNDREKELDVSSFFVGQGKVQEEFWAAADADPDNFKYVAYLFPTLEQAQKALVQLSFVSIDEHGIIQAKRQDLRVGAYDHQGRAVAFLGGESLNYARWREATMTWPELPGAAYFKVSSEPEVHLDIPDMGTEEAGDTITNLGTEDIKGDGGEITRVFKFSCQSKDEALAFLERFTLDEEGVMVQVETEEGTYAKDLNGIFTA